MKSASALKTRKNINSNTLLLLITIILFVILYAAGCVVYGSRGFTNLQTFLNLFRTNAGLICVSCGLTWANSLAGHCGVCSRSCCARASSAPMSMSRPGPLERMLMKRLMGRSGNR